MKLQQGFTALELIISIAMSAIIMTCLLGIYNQVSNNMNKIEQFVVSDMRLLALQNRLGKDLAGLSAIWFTQEKIEEKKAAEQGKQGATEKKEKKLTSKSFYSKNKSNNLDMLTFVTTGALQAFGNNQNRCVRVVYNVQQDPKNKGMLRLMRKEIVTPTEEIDEAALKSGIYYELVSGIASIAMNYTLIDKVAWKKEQNDKKEKDKGAIDQKSSDKKKIVRSVKEWKEAEKKENKEKNGLNNATAYINKPVEKSVDRKSEQEEEQEDVSGAAAPSFVTMDIVFGQIDQQAKRTYKLEFVVPLVADSVPRLSGETKKSTEPAPADKDKKIPDAAPTGEHP